MTKMNPWHPMKDAVDLKHLGKLGEELGECSAAVSRCIIQGIEEREPLTGKPNREWLEDEIADVKAGFALAIERFGLDGDRILNRSLRKIAQLREWHTMAALALCLIVGGCATHPDKLPCEPHTCTPEQQWSRTRDPFGPYPISFGSIFGPQPEPGKVTVEP